MRPVVLSSSAKRRARTSSDTGTCSRAGMSNASPPVVGTSEMMFVRALPDASRPRSKGAAASADASRIASGASDIERRA